MAINAPTVVRGSIWLDERGMPRFRAAHETISVIWASIDSGDTQTPVGPGLAHMTDKHIQVLGTPGSLILVGSDDGTNYNTLHAVDGTTGLTISSAGFYQVLESPDYIGVTTGATSSGATVILTGKVSIV